MLDSNALGRRVWYDQLGLSPFFGKLTFLITYHMRKEEINCLQLHTYKSHVMKKSLKITRFTVQTYHPFPFPLPPQTKPLLFYVILFTSFNATLFKLAIRSLQTFVCVWMEVSRTKSLVWPRLYSPTHPTADAKKLCPMKWKEHDTSN